MKIAPLANEALPLMATWPEFSALFNADADQDARFVQGIGRDIEQVPCGLKHGVNIFGPSPIPIMEARNGLNKMRGIESFLLSNATIIPQSMTILDSKFQLIMAAMENVENYKSIAQYDPSYKLDENADLSVTEYFFQHRKSFSSIALPVSGPGVYNYGHFIYDGLAGAVMHRQALGEGALLVGPPLRKWQEEILAALNLRESYLPIERPTKFDKVLGTTMLSLHVSYPSRFVRLVFDQIRFYFGPSGDRTKTKIFLSRGTDTNKRVLKNRAEVEELMTRLGFEVVCPDLLSFRAQVALMASAHMVVGEAGAGLANIGFCDPGAVVLEILTMADAWIRGQCFVMGHQWHGYFPTLTPDSPTKDTTSYSIDCDDLAATISTVTTNA
jgi:hypothetical protein